MYQSKMALAVKVPSRNKSSVAREIEDAVYLPFGCEYSLLIKNLNSVKALVRVWIDGEDVTDGTQLIIQPNSSLDLERYIKNGNLEAGNKFKFIERTAAVSEHRGNKIDDGLIRVEFEFEKPYVPPRMFHSPLRGRRSGDSWPFPTYSSGVSYTNSTYDSLVGNSTFGTPAVKGLHVDNITCSASGAMQEDYYFPHTNQGQAVSTSVTTLPSEVGITVPGSISDQKFTVGVWFPTDGVKHVMVLRVLGEVDGQEVTKPITVKTKQNCGVCGKSNKVGTKFCGECGAGLQIV